MKQPKLGLHNSNERNSAMQSETPRNIRHTKTILGQVREILKHHPDATLDDVAGLVEVPTGKSHSSIAPSYSIVMQELGLRAPRSKRKQRNTYTKNEIKAAVRLLNQMDSLSSAIDLLRTAAQILAVVAK